MELKTEQGIDGMFQRGLYATLSVLLVVLMVAIATQVLCGALGVNPLFSFDRDYPVVGTAISLNALLDSQWHFLVMIGILPLGLVWFKDQHVRVDFFYSRRSPRWKAGVNLWGHLIFSLPFFFLIIPASFDFVQRSWISREGSRTDGLNDLWLIKAVLPLGLIILFLTLVIETIRLIRGTR